MGNRDGRERMEREGREEGGRLFGRVEREGIRPPQRIMVPQKWPLELIVGFPKKNIWETMQKLPPPQKNIKTKIRGVQSAMPKKNAGKKRDRKIQNSYGAICFF